MVVVVAAALAVDPAGFRPFTTLRWAVVSTTVALAAAAVSTRAPAGAHRRPTLAWAALLGLLAVATVAALDPVVAVVGHPRRHLGLIGWLVGGLAFLVGLRLTRDEQRVYLSRAVVLAGVVTGAGAVADWLGWDPPGLRFADGRVGGLLGQPVYLGALGVLLAPAALGIAADPAFGRGWRRAAVVGAVGCTVAVVVSGTRGAWLGAVVAAAVGWPVLWRWISTHRVLAASILLLVAGLAIGVSTGSRIATLFDPSAEGGRGRLDEWVLGLSVIADDPVTGAGPEGYRVAVLGHIDDGYARRHGRDEVVDRAHNGVLDVAVSAGIPAAAVYLLLLSTVVGRCRQVIRAPADRFLAGAAVGVVAWTVQLAVSFPVAEIDPVAWLLAGCVVSAGVGVGVDAATAGDARGSQRRRPATWLRLGAAALAAVLAVGGVLALGADHDLRRAAQHRLTAPVEAMEAADRATARRPDDTDAWYVAAQVAASGPSLLALDAGLDRVEEGLRWSPRDPALRDLREALLVERALRSGLPLDLRNARRATEERVAADPSGGVHHRRLGLVLAAQGHSERAAAELRRALQLDPDDVAAQDALDRRTPA